jgi:hypothetical protein
MIGISRMCEIAEKTRAESVSIFHVNNRRIQEVSLGLFGEVVSLFRSRNIDGDPEWWLRVGEHKYPLSVLHETWQEAIAAWENLKKAEEDDNAENSKT